MFRIVATTIVVAAVCLVASPTVTAAPIYPAVEPDPFYRAPGNLAGARPGDVLAVRSVTVPGLIGADAHQILFRSTNSVGVPIAAVTTVVSPYGQQPNAPLLSYQHVINGLGLQCAPSHALLAPSSDDLPLAQALDLAIVRGWTVAVPDHLGPTSAYGAARLGGQITLDGIRAAQRVPQLHLAASPVAMVGYSGGGMATAWAAAMAPTVAPELRIVGAAAGGVPMNIGEMALGLGANPHPGFGLAFAAALGLEREYPNRLPISSQLNARGMAMRAQIANACVNDLMRIGSNHSAREMAGRTDLFNDKGAWAVANENSLEFYPGIPRAPLFLWHSVADPLVPFDAARQTAARYCAAGAPLLFDTVTANEHLVAAMQGIPEAYGYISDRFAGRPAPRNC